MSEIEIPQVEIPNVDVPNVGSPAQTVDQAKIFGGAAINPTVQPQAVQPQVAQSAQPQAVQPQVAQSAHPQPVQPQPMQSTPNASGGSLLQNIGVLSFPSTSLMEISAVKDESRTYPRYFAIIMFAPGQADPTKSSGRTYNMNQRSNIKFDIRELFELAYALEEAAATGQTQYVKFADTSKFNGSGQSNIKKVTVNVSNSTNGLKVFLNYEGDGIRVSIPLGKYDAIGLAKQIETLARDAQIEWQRAKSRRPQQG